MPNKAHPMNGAPKKASIKVLALAFGLLALSCASAPPKTERLSTRAWMDADYQRRLDQWPVHFEVRHLSTRYGPTHAILSGPEDAPLLILLHAMGMNALTFAPNVAALSAKYRVAAVDTIGDQGMSIVRRDYPENGREYADWVADVVAALGGGKASLVGCSMGGWIAVCAAAFKPEAIDRLVLISPAAGIPARTRWGSILASVIFDSSEKNLMKFAGTLLGSGSAFRDWTDYFLAACKDFESSKIGTPADLSEKDLRGLSAPVLLLIGEHEAIYEDKKEIIENARRLLPDVQAYEIPGAWHLGHYDNPEFVNDAVMCFLDGR